MSEMNPEAESPQRAETGDAPSSVLSAPPAPARRQWRREPALWAALAVMVLVLALWWDTRSRLEETQVQVAARLAESDTLAKESRALARQNQELLQNLQGKIGALEASLAESRSQQLAIETMYQEFSRSRDDRLLAEVEESISTAIQQLQVGGHVEAALLALQDADARLMAADKPVFLALRKALTRDIETLKALPLVDMAGISVKLETIVSGVDNMQLAFEGKPRAEPPPPEADQTQPVFWRALAAEVWRELRQLVRVQRLDRPEPALLAPEHAFFLRENLKLRLINARLALLQRETASFREDIRRARQWLAHYFDTDQRAVAAAMATLGQLSDADLKLEVPTLEASRTALHTLKTGRDRTVLGH